MIIVRKAKPADLGPLTSLMLQYIVDFYERPQPPIEKIHELIEMLLETKRGVQFVAEREGKLQGFATLYFSFSTTKAAPVTVMNDLFVIEEERGKGGAQKLFACCEQYTKENGYAHMSWVTASSNKRAQRFYEKMGAVQGDWLNYSI